MCGISGLYLSRGQVEQKQLEVMADTIRHRGPDHTGYFLSQDRHIGLAHNRLSILDLSEAGHQPMASPGGRAVIVFNGEIYNFPTLRQCLEKKGRSFRSHSDTEVLLALYEEKGERLLEDLNGMFAFCIYDVPRRLLFLARDRLGVKPLYYTAKESVFAFASELKPLLQLPWVSRDLDIRALDAYFTLGYIPQDMTIFKDIRKLQPGHALRVTLDGDGVELIRYWDVRRRLRERPEGDSDEELTAELESLLRDAVRLRLVSDVPVGCFLSGGLDSGLVAALMAHEAGRPINTFTIRFASNGHDESPLARLIAQHIHSKHTEHLVDMDAGLVLRQLLEHFDEPFADSSMIPTYYVSKVARERVAVALSGDGGDELFVGYNWYSWVFRQQVWQERAGMLSNLATRGSRLLPSRTPGRRFLASLGLDASHQFFERVVLVPSWVKSVVYGPDLVEALSGKEYADVFMDLFNSMEGDILQKMSLTDLHSYLPEDILTKVDRASMAVSLETRTPWLDYRLVEFAFSLPSEWKLRNGQKKYLPKLLAQRLLPENLPLDRKHGFNIPLQEWMRGSLGTLLEENLRNPALSRYLNPIKVTKLLQRHRESYGARHGAALFAILVFGLWSERYLTD